MWHVGSRIDEGGIMADTVSKDELIDVLRTQVTDIKGQLQQKDE